jgi:small subunit ribosomal protein S11
MAENKKKQTVAIKAKPKKKKKKLTSPNGVAHIHSTTNNTIVSIADENGNIIT